jgi:hypothetical protein
MASGSDEGISMQHRWSDDNKGNNRISRRNPCLSVTYPPDTPYGTSIFENRESLITDWRLTTLALHEFDILLITFIIIIIIIIIEILFFT